MSRSLVYYANAAFSPTDIAGLRVWLDFSAVTAGAISSITDKSSNAYVFSQATGTKQPVSTASVLNGLNGALFDGSNDYLSGTPGADLTSTSAFVVAKPTVGVAQYNAIITSTTFATNQTTLEEGASSNLDIWFSNDSNFAATSNNSFQINNPYIVDWLYTSGSGALRINAASTGTTVHTSGFFSCNPMTFGFDNGAGFGAYHGYIFEIVIYDSKLSDANRDLVYNYLKTKWGL